MVGDCGLDQGQEGGIIIGSKSFDLVDRKQERKEEKDINRQIATEIFNMCHSYTLVL